MKHHKIPPRIPPELFKDILCENDLVIVILEHLDYLLKLEGKKSSFGYAAYSLSQLHEPLSTLLPRLDAIKGVGKATEDIIREIIHTGRSTLYEHLLKNDI
jgi:DNA polymerase/3'-5' exonuclease PolX